MDSPKPEFQNGHCLLAFWWPQTFTIYPWKTFDKQAQILKQALTKRVWPDVFWSNDKKVCTLKCSSLGFLHVKVVSIVLVKLTSRIIQGIDYFIELQPEIEFPFTYNKHMRPLILYVVYLDQHLGAAHSTGWSKFGFFPFLHEENKKVL